MTTVVAATLAAAGPACGPAARGAGPAPMPAVPPAFPAIEDVTAELGPFVVTVAGRTPPVEPPPSPDDAPASPAPAGSDHAALVAPVTARLPEVQDCYARALEGEPTLAGALDLLLEIDPGGVVLGASTTPPPGEEGLAAVAGCVEARSRAWPLPARPRAGVARVTIRFVLTPAE
ncbi:MAG: AgmX/PglI C-terminal domain-containing protein [Kofleriaceae bacterium]|nr:AgmX/PglI C-terminal domain-containing protein [Kofleriaceae bacterium]MCL4224922.1 AgmX/PglI C-terminal domain-containing protein [Myxococcales bacterium]